MLLHHFIISLCEEKHEYQFKFRKKIKLEKKCILFCFHIVFTNQIRKIDCLSLNPKIFTIEIY